MVTVGARLIGCVVAATAFTLTSQLALGTPAACGLLTSAEIGSTLSVSIGAGVPLRSSTTSSCKWEQQGVDAFRAVTVIISTKSAQAFEVGKSVMQPVPVSGIGDDAYLTGKSISYTVLSIKKGQTALTITVRGLKDLASVQSAERALGKVAVAKL